MRRTLAIVKRHSPRTLSEPDKFLLLAAAAQSGRHASEIPDRQPRDNFLLCLKRHRKTTWLLLLLDVCKEKR